MSCEKIRTPHEICSSILGNMGLSIFDLLSKNNIDNGDVMEQKSMRVLLCYNLFNKKLTKMPIEKS
jgi:hypothetical protein